MPCDLDEDRTRDFLVETRGLASSAQYQVFFFPGIGGEPMEVLSRDEPVDMDGEMPEAYSVFVGFSPGTDDVGNIGFFRGKPVLVELFPLSDEDGSLVCDTEAWQFSLDSSGKRWTSLLLKPRKKGLNLKRIYIPTKVYQEMGFVAAEETPTWKLVPLPGRPGVPGPKVSRNLPVTVKEQKKGFCQIGDVKNPLWIEGTGISKFPR